MMATGVTIRNFFLLLAVGHKTATLQQRYIAAQSQLAGKRDRAEQLFGRPYHSQMPVASFDQLPGFGLLKSVAAVVTKPFRMIAAIGDYNSGTDR